MKSLFWWDEEEEKEESFFSLVLLLTNDIKGLLECKKRRDEEKEINQKLLGLFLKEGGSLVILHKSSTI